MLAIILLMIASFSFVGIVSVGATGIDECHQALPPVTPVTAVHVQPESGHQPILDEINQARCSIDLMMYFFTDQTVVDSFERAIARGVRVRVILEKTPFGSFGNQQEMFDRLQAIGAEVRWSPDSFTFGHAKYMIVDNNVLVVTNQNFTGAGFNSNREFGLITTEQKFVSEAVPIFEADWNGRTLDIEFEHLVVSPVNARSTVLSLINSSEKTLWMYSEVLRDEEVTSALNAAADRGVDVRVLVNPSADAEDVPYFLDALSHGVQIRVLQNPYVHSKVIIVDGARALVGSHNYSYTSLELNREVGIVMDGKDDLNLLSSVYARDWARAVPVDTVTEVKPARQISLTPQGGIGRISSGRWGVV